MDRHPWLGVEMRDLATLVAVARTGSFRQAAADLGYVQSAVSQQISRLEQAVGTRLVERRRGRRGVSLTPAGRVLFERSAGILGQLAAARTDIDASPDLLRVALAGEAGARLLAEILPRAALPGLRLHVAESTDAELAGALERGTADVGIGAPDPAADLVTVPLLDDPFVLLARRDSPLAAAGGVTSVADLGDEPLIVAAWEPREPARRTLRVPWSGSVPALAACGAGIGLLPRSEAGDCPPNLVALPAAGLAPPRRVALCWHAARRRTETLERFAAAAARPRLVRAA